jgi:sec-independent protein translocase protein TatA
VTVFANVIDISPLTLLVLLVLALLILGPGKLPEVGAALGKSIREFRKASIDVQDSMRLEPTASSASSAAPARTAPAEHPVEPPPDKDAQIRMLEARLAALEQERESERPASEH